MPAGSKRMLVNISTNASQRHAVLQAVAHRDREAVHDAGERRALLRDLEEHLAGAAVLELADRHVAVAVGDPERERLRRPHPRQLLADRLLHDHVLDDALDDPLADAPSAAVSAAPPSSACERLTDLAVVAVDRDRLEAERHDSMWSSSTSSTVASSGRFTVLRDRTREERLHRTHHRDVTHVVDRVVAHRAREHRQVLGVELGRADDRLVLVDVGDDRRRPARRSSRGGAAPAGSSG